MPPADDRVRELLWRHVSGALEGPEEEELRRVLIGHPEYAATLAEMAEDRLALETLLREERVTGRRRRFAFHPAKRGTPVFGLVAAACLLGVILLAVATPWKAGRPREGGAPPPATPDLSVDPAPEAEPAPPAPPPLRPPRPDRPPAPPRAEEASPVEVPVAPVPARPPDVAPPPSRVPPPTPPAPRETRPSLALLEVLEGEAEVREPSGPVPAKQGRWLTAGDGLSLRGSPSRAELRFSDGTRLVLSGDVDLRELRDRVAPRTGKRVVLERGTLRADVAAQPAGEPMVFSTPHAEAIVLGTTLRLAVEAGDKGSTRLDVEKGKVRLTRTADGKSVDVLADHFAVAAAGVPLASKPAVPPLLLQVSFGPADAPVPPGFSGDDGSRYDPKVGRGWSRDLRPAGRYREAGKDLLHRRILYAGDAKTGDRWEIDLPNGKYLVTLSCGDPVFPQGPHRVVVEGRPAIRDAMTAAGEFLKAQDVPVVVRDGRLTLEVGAVGSTRLDPDQTSDTGLNYVIIRRAE